MPTSYLNNVQDVAKCALVLLAPQMIYVIAITFSMLFINGKLFWVLNLVTIFPQLFTAFLCLKTLKEPSNLKTDCLPIWMYVQVAMSFCYFFETLLEGFDSLYTTSAGGKISASIIGLILVLAWGQLAYEAKVVSENNMTGDKREKFIQSRRLGANMNRNRAAPAANRAPLVDQESAPAPSILQNRLQNIRNQSNQNRAPEEEKKADPRAAAAAAPKQNLTSLNRMSSVFSVDDESSNLLATDANIDAPASSLAPAASNQNRYDYGTGPVSASAKKKTTATKSSADEVRAQRLALLGKGRGAASAEPLVPQTEKSCPVCTFKNQASAEKCEVCDSGFNN